MEKAFIASAHELKGIRVAMADPHHMLAMDTFNSYVHNMHFSPISNNLKTSWDNMQAFMEKLWGTISEKNPSQAREA